MIQRDCCCETSTSATSFHSVRCTTCTQAHTAHKQASSTTAQIRGRTALVVRSKQLIYRRNDGNSSSDTVIAAALPLLYKWPLPSMDLPFAAELLRRPVAGAAGGVGGRHATSHVLPRAAAPQHQQHQQSAAGFAAAASSAVSVVSTSDLTHIGSPMRSHQSQTRHLQGGGAQSPDWQSSYSPRGESPPDR
jgi:hypothetical protein